MRYPRAAAGNLKAATAASLMALISGLGLISGSSEIWAQMRTADPKRGQELAQKLCAGCHLVAPAATAPTNPDVPSFASIARRQGNTAERLAGLSYPASGGFSHGPFLPWPLWTLLHRIDARLPPALLRWTGFRMLVVLERT